MKENQKKLIIDLLKANENTSLSADALEKSLPEISKATLYRYLDNLCLLEEVRKIYNSQTNKYEYQYVYEECHNHLHLKCEVCGKVIHLDCKETKLYFSHIEKEHQFIIDGFASTIYGVCMKCQGKEIKQ